MRRRIMSLFLLLALCVGMAVPAMADTVDSTWNGDFSTLFTVTTNFHPEWGLYDDQYAIQTITGYRGAETDIVIPSVDADGEPIQAIHDNAFQNNTLLTGVTVPDSITSIGFYAFSGCTNLARATIPDSVVRLGNGAFSNCSSLTQVTLPAGLTALEQSTFFFCENLAGIVIPDGVTTIGNSAFWGCSSLASVTIPASVTSIDYGAFMDCSKLTDVYFKGTAEQWAAININNNQNYNDSLLKAAIHYGSGDSSEPSASAGTSFTDVAAGIWYAAPVEWAVGEGITNGTGAATFSPNATCTRAQIITFLWRAAGSPEPKNLSAFPDVKADAYYAKAVAWAAENGMASGGTFSPDAPCTRLMAVEFMWKQAGSPGGVSAGFADVSSDAVNWAVKEGVTSGTGAGVFSPDTACTRAQIVTFLYRAFAE